MSVSTSIFQEKSIPDWSNLRYNSVYNDDKQGWTLKIILVKPFIAEPFYGMPKERLFVF